MKAKIRKAIIYKLKHLKLEYITMAGAGEKEKPLLVRRSGFFEYLFLGNLLKTYLLKKNCSG
jgi:hypothetical protein